MIFKRNKKNDDVASRGASGDAAENPDAADNPDAAASDATAVAPGVAAADGGAAGGPASGPFDADADEVPDHAAFVDLGALLVEPVEGMQLRLEVEDQTKRVVAVALELDGSRLQLQVFAAPKSDTLWPGISEQIAAGIVGQGGKVDRVQGRFGEELVARVPSAAPDGTQGFMVARFIGIDGPRWFLRGVVGGPATLDRAQAGRLEDRIARLIVVRGDQPMPPAELLPLKMPAGAVVRPDNGTQHSADGRPIGRPERGPETTHIG